MAGRVSYSGKVAVITGAGGGLGRAYALEFGRRGAKVVVNDLGGDTKGEGKSSRAADKVVEEIRSQGGTAVANYDSVEDGEKVIQTALDNFGRVDIVVNNAGILRDRSFPRTSDTDWDLVHRVHLRGAFKVTRAAFPIMKQQKYGRIIMTSSSSGIFGNFGQANYSAAKLGLMGLSNTVAIEGRKYNIHCNTIAPVSGTRMTQGIIPDELFDALTPELVAPLVLWLCHNDCEETGGLYCAGGGWFNQTKFQSSAGKMCRGRIEEPVSVETVRDNWQHITDFSKPSQINSGGELTGNVMMLLQEMKEQPAIKSNQTAAASPALTGPMSALGLEAKADDFSYTDKEAILYALGVGVSTRDEDGLQFLYENHENFSPLPTFSIMAAMRGIDRLFQSIQGWTPDFTRMVHGEMYLENMKQPLPSSATLESFMSISAVLDKGSAGVVFIMDGETKDKAGEMVCKTQFSLFFMGSGNFGGPRTSSVVVPLHKPPARAPDASVDMPTDVDQAALYRLSGDRNPLHIDPSFAAMGGFDQPILHGLCTYGVTALAILRQYCNSDVTKFKAMKTRFAKPVLPGQTLRVDMWREGARVFFTTSIKETGKLCLTGGYVDLVAEAGEVQEKAIGVEMQSTAVMEDMARRLAAMPDLAKKIQAIFVWKVNKDKELAGQWTVDLKNGSGSLYKGAPLGGEKANVTLTLEDEDLVAMATGKLNAQKAFMSGRLKVAGNVMLTQKLEPLLRPQAKM